MTSEAYRKNYAEIAWNVRPKSAPKPLERDLRYDGPIPHFWNDIPKYVSPLSGKEITSRSERREEMRKHGVREVEPSEFKVRYQNEAFMRKHGIVNRDD